MAAVEISLVEKAVSCLLWHFESLFSNFLNKILNWIFWTNFWMDFWLNEYFKFSFELNIELIHFWARFNVWLNNRNVSDRATPTPPHPKKQEFQFQTTVHFSADEYSGRWKIYYHPIKVPSFYQRTIGFNLSGEKKQWVSFGGFYILKF